MYVDLSATVTGSIEMEKLSSCSQFYINNIVKIQFYILFCFFSIWAIFFEGKILSDDSLLHGLQGTAACQLNNEKSCLFIPSFTMLQILNLFCVLSLVHVICRRDSMGPSCCWLVLWGGIKNFTSKKI